jgi:oxygen-dependent protoporphyrinogen oxidase
VSHVVVVGGGIAGLSAADALLALGAAVTLIEATTAVGGKLRTSEVGGVAVDEGAESFLRRRPEGLDLVDRLGLADELVSPAASTASVWARGRLRPVPARTVMGVPSDPATLHGVLSVLEVARVRLDRLLPGAPPIDDIAVGEWLGHRLGAAVVDRLVDPLLGGVYAGRARELSLAATLPQLPRDQRSALAAAGRALPATSPGAVPAPVFATLPGGMGTLPSALAGSIQRRGGTILTSRTVRGLHRIAAGWRIVHGPTTDAQPIEADGVVLALPAATARRLLADLAPVAAADLGGIDAASVAIVTTVWRRRDAGSPAGSGYLIPANLGRPVKAVTFASTKWRHLDRDDLTIVRCSIGRYRDLADLQRDDADLIKAAATELTTYAGFQGTPVASRVTRWGGGLPQYAVGHLARVARIRAAVAPLPGLAVCGASYDGVGIPACISTGRLAAEQVLATVRTPESP